MLGKFTFTDEDKVYSEKSFSPEAAFCKAVLSGKANSIPTMVDEKDLKTAPGVYVVMLGRQTYTQQAVNAFDAILRLKSQMVKDGQKAKDFISVFMRDTELDYSNSRPQMFA